jgi:hypothetical protein
VARIDRLELFGVDECGKVCVRLGVFKSLEE